METSSDNDSFSASYCPCRDRNNTFTCFINGGKIYVSCVCTTYVVEDPTVLYMSFYCRYSFFPFC